MLSITSLILLTVSAQGADSAWRPLWDGKSLQGWHQIGKGEWTIKDGAIIGRHSQKEPSYGHLVTDAIYKDFTIKVTYKSLKGNSGLYFRIEEKGASGVSGFQAEIDPRNDVGGLYETNGRAWVVRPTADEIKKFFKPDDWNTMVVSAQGTKVRVEVNGQQTAEIDDPKGRKQGYIALQVHGGQDVLVMFKDLFIKGDPVPQPKVQASDPKEPMAAKFSLARAVSYLDDVNLKWTRQRKCGSCHTNYPYLMFRSTLNDGDATAFAEIRDFFQGRAANWDTAKPRWDTEVVATAVSLAIHDANSTGKLQDVTRKALDRMWTLQSASGAWSWLKCGWPPMEHDDYFGATYAALGVGLAPDDYAHAPSAQEGIKKLRGYFKKNAPPDLHHRTMLLWASLKLEGLMDTADREQTVKSLLAIQRSDGGWSLPSLGNYPRHQKDKDGKPIMNDKNAPSDGYGTGFVIYVLRQAGVPANDPQTRRGIAWLSKNQRESGRWFTRSLNTDSYHFITHAGTAFAVMALRSCQE